MSIGWWGLGSREKRLLLCHCDGTAKYGFYLSCTFHLKICGIVLSLDKNGTDGKKDYQKSILTDISEWVCLGKGIDFSQRLIRK